MEEEDHDLRRTHSEPTVDERRQASSRAGFLSDLVDPISEVNAPC